MAISFSLTNNASGRFAINSSTGAVTTLAGSIAAGTYNIVVRATDGSGWFKDTTFPITVAASGGGGGTIVGAWGTPGTTGTVSGNDFAVTGGQAHGSCRVGPGHTSGKYTAEFEVILNGNSGVTKPQLGFGIADAGTNVSSYLGANPRSGMYWLELDQVFASGVTSGGTIAAADLGVTGVGAKFQVHLDIDNGKAWLSKNGVVLGSGSPNPVTGVAPFLTFTPGGFTWSIGATGMAFGGDVKLRLASSLSSAAPSGYTAMLGA
jgi:hypothetical protein